MIRPTGNKILVLLDREPPARGLLIVPDSYRGYLTTGTIMGWGQRVTTPLEMGQHVQIRNAICGYDLNVDGQKCRLVFDGDIVGLCEPCAT